MEYPSQPHDYPDLPTRPILPATIYLDPPLRSPAMVPPRIPAQASAGPLYDRGFGEETATVSQPAGPTDNLEISTHSADSPHTPRVALPGGGSSDLNGGVEGRAQSENFEPTIPGESVVSPDVREPAGTGVFEGGDELLAGEDPIAAAERQIKERLIANVPDIAAVAEESEVVIVSGPHGGGKSQSLIPALTEQFETAGHMPFAIDIKGLAADEVGQFLSELPEPEQSQKGVLIVDEAGTLTAQPLKIIEAAGSRGYRVVAIVAHDIDSESSEPESAWQTAAGGTAPVFRQPSGKLPEELAREYISESATRMGSPPEVSAWLADNVPPYLSALHSVPFARTIGQARQALLDNLEPLERSIPRAELEALKAKLTI